MNQILVTSLLALALLLSALVISAQSDTTYNGHTVSSDWEERGLTLGFNGGRNLYGEVGHYRGVVWEAGGFPTLSGFMHYGAEFSVQDGFILAPKIQARMHVLFFNASLSALYYTNFDADYAVKLRPELGVGLANLDINYGYNLGVVRRELGSVNRHMISLRYYLSLRQKLIGEYDRHGNPRPE